SLNSCDAFVQKFRAYGLAPDVICPTAGRSETLTVCLRRPPMNPGFISSESRVANTNSNPQFIQQQQQQVSQSSSSGFGTTALARGVISIHSLSYGTVRVDSEDSLTSLTLQDCGQVLPGCKLICIYGS
ncbi:unnamed protein product, partial [Protopolystoma xenopodis]